MKQKIFYLGPDSSFEPNVSTREVQSLLAEGWTVASVIAQHCSVAGGGQTYSSPKAYGGFIVVIEKTEEK